ncbi:hypothetical protein BKA57DRAFT_456505 [Linnemannia elongata]|nr:hypothetical protein BKA57DRAFT_456505 [Linnemannia elongata]
MPWLHVDHSGARDIFHIFYLAFFFFHSRRKHVVFLPSTTLSRRFLSLLVVPLMCLSSLHPFFASALRARS